MDDSTQYIYSKVHDTSLRGGTEKIEGLLLKKTNFKKISGDELKRKKGSVILIGVGLREMMSLLVRSRCSINVLKTATYSKKRFILEKIMYFVLHPFVRVTVISKWQAPYYYKSEILNLYDLYSQDSLGSCEMGSAERKYKFGYIGRIDRDKGYFEAKEILLKLSLDNKCLMDVLLWSDTDIRHLPPRDTENLDIIVGGRDKMPPKFHEIDALILPYRSLDSTIAIPLVLLEACLSGCIVYTSDVIVSLMHDEFPQLKPYIKTIRNLQNGK